MISQEPKFSCLSYAINLVTGEGVEILGIQYFEGFGYGYLCRSLMSGGLYEVNSNAYYPEIILSSFPQIVRKGKIGRHQYLVNVIPLFSPEAFSIMYSIDGIFRTGKKRGVLGNLIGYFDCPVKALQTGISLVMEEFQNERKF